MIKINDLRVGNYLMVCLPLNSGGTDDYIVQITAVTPDKIFFKGKTSGFATIECFKPITLTEEILLKCGFELSSHYGSWDHEEMCAVITPNNGDRYWRLDPFAKAHDGKLYLTSEAEYTISEVPIEYLHQLQNVFYCLTGKELEVRL